MTKAAHYFRRLFARFLPARERSIPHWVQEELAFSEATARPIAPSRCNRAS